MNENTQRARQLAAALRFLRTAAEDQLQDPELANLLSVAYVARMVLLTEKQLAKLTGFSVRSLQNWRIQGRPPKFVEISPRCIRYRLEDVCEWLDDRVRTSTSEGAGS